MKWPTRIRALRHGSVSEEAEAPPNNILLSRANFAALDAHCSEADSPETVLEKAIIFESSQIMCLTEKC